MGREEAEGPSEPNFAQKDEFMELVGSLLTENKERYESQASRFLQEGELSVNIEKILLFYKLEKRACVFRTSRDGGFNYQLDSSIALPRKKEDQILTLTFEFARGEASLRQ
jgi:hypothetical protein